VGRRVTSVVKPLNGRRGQFAGHRTQTGTLHGVSQVTVPPTVPVTKSRYSEAMYSRPRRLDPIGPSLIARALPFCLWPSLQLLSPTCLCQLYNTTNANISSTTKTKAKRPTNLHAMTIARQTCGSRDYEPNASRGKAIEDVGTAWGATLLSAR